MRKYNDADRVDRCGSLGAGSSTAMKCGEVGSGRPVTESRCLAWASWRISASPGLGGGILASRASSHCSLPSHGGSLVGGSGTISLISGTEGEA